MGNMSVFVNVLCTPLLIFDTAMDASLLREISVKHSAFPCRVLCWEEGVEKRGRLSVIAQ